MYSKQIIAIPSNIELNAEGWGKALRDHVVAHHGLPRKIISNRGTEFKNKFISELYQSLGIEANPSTAYHPQTDGQTERINQEIEQYLRLFINYRQADWAEWLPLAAFSYNNKVHSTTGYTLFFVNKGYHPYEGTQPVREGLSENVQQFVDRMNRVREDTSAAISLAQESMKRFYDRKRKSGPEYKTGDKVWLEGINIRTDRPMKKLDDKRYGPFQVKCKVSASAYELKLPRQWKQHPVFNESLLSPFREPTYSSQQREPVVPDLVNGEEEWEVEEILDSRRDRNGNLEYQVLWKNSPHGDRRSWESRANLTNCQELLQEFHTRRPDKPAPMTIQIPPLLTRPVHILMRDATLLVQQMGGILPKQGSEEATGLDLYSAESVKIPARGRKIIGTGIAMRAPHGTYARIAP